jgi:hypothetical protein
VSDNLVTTWSNYNIVTTCWQLGFLTSQRRAFARTESNFSLYFSGICIPISTNFLNVPHTNHHLAMPMHIRLLANVSVQCRFFILKHMSWRGFVSELPESIAKLPLNVSSVCACEAERPWSKNMSRARVLNLFEVVQATYWRQLAMCLWSACVTDWHWLLLKAPISIIVV